MTENTSPTINDLVPELPPDPFSILVTGAGGYIGQALLHALDQLERDQDTVVALDIREPTDEERVPGFHYEVLDIREPALADLMERYQTTTVVHLASIVTPSKKMSRDFIHSVDVGGTKNIIEACLKTGADHLIITSSGAAYGYHADNPEWLTEDDAIRGNREFAYSDHKRQVEDILAQLRNDHPELKQLILRPGTILGEAVSNQITALFEKDRILGLRGSSIPFVFIWDRDVIATIVKGIYEVRTGIYNLAGDGTLTMEEIAGIMGKKYVEYPVGLIKFGLWFMKLFGLTRYGPEQVNFLRYRPVLSNAKLKAEFGYTPALTTKEVFMKYLRAHES